MTARAFRNSSGEPSFFPFFPQSTCWPSAMGCHFFFQIVCALKRNFLDTSPIRDECIHPPPQGIARR